MSGKPDMAWEQESKDLLNKWRRAVDADGREYYWLGDSKEVTWEHPGEKILPAYYMKVKILDRLSKGVCEQEQGSQTPPYSFEDELSELGLTMKTEALPGGLAAVALHGAGAKAATGSSWWWGCGPLTYLDEEAAERAYTKGATAGRQLFVERACVAEKEITALPDSGHAAADEGEEANAAQHHIVIVPPQ